MTRFNDQRASGKRALRGVVVAILLAVYVGLAGSSIREKSPTFDEFGHLTGGYSYWKTGDYRLFPQNGKLPTRWVALPLLAGDFRFPSLNQDQWRGADIDAISYQFFYACGNDPQRMVRLGRWMVVALGVAVCWMVYLWSSALFGTAGGFLSLALCVLSPAMLAHGRLATSDMAAALTLTASVGLFWVALHWLDLLRITASGLMMAAVVATKMSGVLIVPMALLLVGVRLAVGRPLLVSIAGRRKVLPGGSRQVAACIVLLAVHAAFVVFVLWACHGFRFSPFREGEAGIDRMFGGETIDSLTGQDATGSAIRWARDQRLLPEAYLFGLAHVARRQQHPAFFCGETSLGGWWTFFPYCFLVKTPLPTLLVCLLALIASLRGKVHRLRNSVALGQIRRAAYRAVPLWTLLVVYWAVAISSRLNIGERHIIPTYAAIFILAGAAGCWWTARRGRWMLAGLVAWLLLEVLFIYPHFLAYFNQLVGGPKHGYRCLVDSSLDWGQDLPSLQRWLKDPNHGVDKATPVYLSYFGVADPDYYGIEAHRLLSYGNWQSEAKAHSLAGGVYCVSATMLQCVYAFPVRPWTPALDRRYRFLLAELDQSPALLSGSDSDAQSTRRQFELLQFGKLCHYLRRREPDDSVGYSILIYRLSDREVQQALGLDRLPGPH